MIRPIRPDEVNAPIPALVLDAFNAEIALRFWGRSALVPQEAVIRRLEVAGRGRREIFDAGWLFIESAYREAGWRVSYQKSAFDQGGAGACFLFEAA